MDQYWSACEPIVVGAATNTGSQPYPPRGSTLLHKKAPPTEGLTAQDQRLRWEGQEGYLEVREQEVFATPKVKVREKLLLLNCLHHLLYGTLELDVTTREVVGRRVVDLDVRL